jgi:hypothetical protein
MATAIGTISTPILPEKFAPVRQFLDDTAKEAGLPTDQLLVKLGEQLQEAKPSDIEQAKEKIGVASYIRVDPADQEYIANGINNAGKLSAEMVQLGVGAIALGAVMKPLLGDMMSLNF